MQKDYTRDVSEEMIKALNGVFKPFVDFVKNNKELALCFRGNDSAYGKVIIYWHNHVIWKLSIPNNKQAKVEISANHARFMEKWQDEIEKLMKLGFRGPNNEDHASPDLVIRHPIKSNKKDVKYTYDIANLTVEEPIKGGSLLNEQFVKKSFDILAKMQNDFFSPKHTEKERPKNFIKECYFKNNKDKKDEDKNQNLYCNFQSGVEKHAQLDLFLHNHKLDSGVFVYDLEFAQPNVGELFNTDNKQEVLKIKNQPDMFGIRFENGKPKAICMIEVKSTKSAITGKSGLKEHLAGMNQYRYLVREGKTIRLMSDRKEEALRILNQYREIGLYGVSREYKEKEFLNLDEEIIFVFTNGVFKTDVFNNLDTVETFLDQQKFMSDNVLEYGDYCKIIDPQKEPSKDNTRDGIDVFVKKFKDK